MHGSLLSASHFDKTPLLEQASVVSAAAVQQVLALASELTDEERRVVVDAIAPQESVAALAAEWQAEIAQRAKRIRSGQSQGKPAAEVFDRLELKSR